MKKTILFLLTFIASVVFAADVKISQLPLGTASTTGVNDSFPYVASTTNITKKMTIWDIVNIPTIVSTYAPKASPVFTGTVTAPTFIGSLTGNASTATALAANPTDCTSGQYANAIAANGNLTCSAVSTSQLSGTLSASSGGTGQTTVLAAFQSFYESVATTLGDIIYGGASGAPTRLAGNTTTTPKFLKSLGSGGLATAPSWTQPACSDLSNAATSCSTDTTNASNISSGTLDVGHGGTGQTSYTNGQILIGNTTGNTLAKSTLTAGTGISITNGSGSITIAGSPTTPTIQKFTSGSGTYTKPAGVLYLRVRAVGGGAGGAGSSQVSGPNGGAGGAGVNTTFGSSLVTANGGSATIGSGSHVGSAGGSASIGAGGSGTALQGGTGGAVTLPATGGYAAGGQGASSAFGGGGGGGAGSGASAGLAGVANTGGGGGGAAGPVSGYSGEGGGSGGFVDAIITSPSATYSYSVGAGGTSGSAGTSGQAGGAGGSGYIEVTEYYQ